MPASNPTATATTLTPRQAHAKAYHACVAAYVDVQNAISAEYGPQYAATLAEKRAIAEELSVIVADATKAMHADAQSARTDYDTARWTYDAARVTYNAACARFAEVHKKYAAADFHTPPCTNTLRAATAR